MCVCVTVRPPQCTEIEDFSQMSADLFHNDTSLLCPWSPSCHLLPSFHLWPVSDTMFIYPQAWGAAGASLTVAPDMARGHTWGHISEDWVLRSPLEMFNLTGARTHWQEILKTCQTWSQKECIWQKQTGTHSLKCVCMCVFVPFVSLSRALGGCPVSEPRVRPPRARDTILLASRLNQAPVWTPSNTHKHQHTHTCSHSHLAC